MGAVAPMLTATRFVLTEALPRSTAFAWPSPHPRPDNKKGAVRLPLRLILDKNGSAHKLSQNVRYDVVCTSSHAQPLGMCMP